MRYHLTPVRKTIIEKSTNNKCWRGCGFCPWDSPGKNTGVGCHALLQGNLPNPGIEPRSPALQADCLPSEAPGKPQNTGMGSLSLLQWNFPTQVSNQGLLYCRQILYQLSYPTF